VAHEGRHRADVFKEKGLDLMPVRVTHSTMRWGEAHAEDFPRRVISENGKFVDFPQPENWKGVENDLDFTKMPLSNKGPMGRQRGTIDFGIFKKNSDKDVAKKGFIPALLDARKQFQMEKRDLPTPLKILVILLPQELKLLQTVLLQFFPKPIKMLEKCLSGP
jgi:hypothetical protein